MSDVLHHIEYDELSKILNKYDRLATFDPEYDLSNHPFLRKALSDYVNVENFSIRCILGIDIYKYNSYNDLEQALIPFIFKKIFGEAISLALRTQEFVFQNESKERIEGDFISTGDGGFFLFDTPLHALIFACQFELMVRAYNAFHFYPKLRSITGEINLRYAITFDKVFAFDNNHYGPGIINNARILSKDSLNRCLIEDSTYAWFMRNMAGIENLQMLTLEDIARIPAFKNYSRASIANGRNTIFPSNYRRDTGIINADLLKIGNIKSKSTQLNIYNLHVQVHLALSASDDKTKRQRITISLGNLNTSGISE
jgi:hypothetical protein